MRSVDFHPEHLIDHVVRGVSLSKSDAEPQLHLQECHACRLELDLHAALNAEPEVLTGDGELIERAIERATLQLSQGGVHRIGDAKHLRTKHRRFSPIMLGIGVSLMAAAAAALGLVLQFVSSDGVETAGADAKLAPSIEARPREAVRDPNGDSETAPSVESVVQVRNRPPEKPEPSATKEGGRGTQLSGNLSPAELFAQATALRRAGEASRAVRVFRQLQRQHPSSPEAGASRLSLARLLMEHTNDPGGALLQFEAYLKSGGPLEQEALVGQALALDRLGRPAEARGAWRQVLRRYPGSTYAKQARLKVESDP
ncbi:MAG: tetratricopeptide repeat protein [Polyangiaceae bacterium]|nr:tetratricopeptide repeat protein [Polyangiaceae bacterium]